MSLLITGRNSFLFNVCDGNRGGLRDTGLMVIKRSQVYTRKQQKGIFASSCQLTATALKRAQNNKEALTQAILLAWCVPRYEKQHMVNVIWNVGKRAEGHLALPLGYR